MKKKLKEWFKRYLPAEISGTIGAILVAQVVFLITENRILSAYAGTIGEGISFYGTIFIREQINDLKKSKEKGKKHGIKEFSKTIRNLLVEFGPAEFLDSILIRPFFMYLFPVIIGNFAIGLFVGKIVADIVFYIPTIVMYELKKKHLK